MKQQNGFTLIELMVTVAIISILAAVAVPNFSEYLIRSRIQEATGSLGAGHTMMEQYFQDNHEYKGTGHDGCANLPTKSGKFTISCTSTASTFTITATGSGPMAGFTFAIDQSGLKQTTNTPSGWPSTPLNCWVTSKGSTC